MRSMRQHLKEYWSRSSRNKINLERRRKIKISRFIKVWNYRVKEKLIDYPFFGGGFIYNFEVNPQQIF